jgi:hypothetical protein
MFVFRYVTSVVYVRILWNNEINYALSSRHGASSGCACRRRPPDTKGSCEHAQDAQDEAADGGKSELVVGADMDDKDQSP